MSGGWTPPTVSNGFIETTVTPSLDSSGTTCTPSVSSTAQVSVTVKVSPMRTAPSLERVQQRMGSISTVPGVGDDWPGGVAGAGADGDAGRGAAVEAAGRCAVEAAGRCAVGEPAG